MCLYTTSKKVQVAKEDIVCYKILIKLKKKGIFRIFRKFTYRAPFHCYYTYRLKKLYDLGRSLKCKLFTKGCPTFYVVSEGYHTFEDIQDARDMLLEWYETPGMQKIVQCIIPKGAEYVKGTTYLYNSVVSYVSNKLVCLKEI